MEELFSLKKILAEIKEDQSAEETKHRLLTADGVKQRVARRQKARRLTRRNK